MTSIRRGVLPILLAVAGGIMLWVTRGSWPDVLIDFGRELYVPWRLTEGDVLYRDVAYLNGPLSPYLNALWFSIFGVGLRTLVIVNGLIAVGIVVLLYRLTIAIGGRLGALAAGMTFVLVFACLRLMDSGNYNYLTPYSHEITHGCALALLSLWACFRFRMDPRLHWVILAGAGLGLAFLTKSEIFLAAVVGGGATLLPAGSGENRGRTVGFLGLSAMAAVLLAWGLLSPFLPLKEAVSGTFDAWRHVLNDEVQALGFYRWRMGLDAPLANLGKMLGVLGLYLAVLLPPAVVARFVRKRGSVEYVIAGGTFLALAVALSSAIAPQSWLEAARPFPLFMLASAVGWGVVAWRSTADARKTALLRMAVSAFAFTLLLKMILNARVSHYGFVLAMPAAVVVVVAIVEWTPQAIARRGGSALVFRVAALAVVALFAAGHVRHSRLHLDHRQSFIGEGFDRFRVGARGERVSEALQEAVALVGPGQTMAVLPEGVMLNYLARRENPTRYINLMPPEVVLFGEEPMLNAFRRNPPDLIVYVAKDTSEYGMGQFGSGYAKEIWSWIAENYRHAREYEPPGQRIWLLVPRATRTDLPGRTRSAR